MFQVTDNYYDSRSGRRIIKLQSIAGNLQIITADFDDKLEDFDNLSTDELVKLVHNWYYRTFLQGKFVKEAVELTEAKAKEMTELVEQTKKVFADAESQLASLKERSELAQGSVLEMTEMLFDHEFRITALEGGDLIEDGIESTDETVEDTNAKLEGGE